MSKKINHPAYPSGAYPGMSILQHMTLEIVKSIIASSEKHAEDFVIHGDMAGTDYDEIIKASATAASYIVDICEEVATDKRGA